MDTVTVPGRMCTEWSKIVVSGVFSLRVRGSKEKKSVQIRKNSKETFLEVSDEEMTTGLEEKDKS